MSYTDWLHRQVQRLEEEIRTHPVFEDDQPATPDQLHELRRTIVLHTYLRQQLRRREPARLDRRSTQEFLLVEVPFFPQTQV